LSRFDETDPPTLERDVFIYAMAPKDRATFGTRGINTWALDLEYTLKSQDTFGLKCVCLYPIMPLGILTHSYIVCGIPRDM